MNRSCFGYARDRVLAPTARDKRVVMSNQTTSDHTHDTASAHCPRCHQPLNAGDAQCAHCGQPLGALPATSLLSRPPFQWLIRRQGFTRLLISDQVVFQVLPSGACLKLPAAPKLTLGRGPADPGQPLIDLEEHNGYQRGVSRRHCALLRRDDHLYIVDLGSSNGTSLNGERLAPHHPYKVADGDKLILGSMHLSVSFFPPDTSLTDPDSA